MMTDYQTCFANLQHAVAQIASRRYRDGYCWCAADWDPIKHGHLRSCSRLRDAYHGVQDPFWIGRN